MNPVFRLTLITTMNHVCFAAMRFTLLRYTIHLGASSTTVDVGRTSSTDNRAFNLWRHRKQASASP